MINEIISQISKEFLREAKDSPRLLEDLASMEKYLAESYSGRVFIELLQNADDAGSTKIELINVGDHIIFANNGNPFTKNDVIAISRSGTSFKDREQNIGYRGIGFKSTSYLTNKIVIFSDDTYFTFSKEVCSKELNIIQDKIPTIRIPFLIDTIESNIQKVIDNLKEKGFSTIFIFYNVKLSEFENEISEINDGYFIFLRNIISCTIVTQNHSLFYSITRSKFHDFQLVSLTGKYNKQWIIKSDRNTQIAFMYVDGKITPCTEEEAVFHSFLPTVDRVFCPVKINADFATDPSRKHLTVNENTITKMFSTAATLFDLLRETINGGDSIYLCSNLLQILSQRIGFSKANVLLLDNLKKILTSSKWLKINNGQNINLIDYKLLPNWLEESEKNLIRTNSEFVNAQSLVQIVYQSVPSVDLFLQQFSASKYSSQDLIEIIKDKNFVNKIDPQLHGKLLANIIKNCKLDNNINNMVFEFDELLLHTMNDNETISIFRNNKNHELESAFLTSIQEYASNSEIEWFCQTNSLSEKSFSKKTTPMETNFGKEFLPSTIKNNVVISKWRTAEQQCVQIEENFGNVATDVGKQNFGYDVESIDKNGNKRFIEVKSINNIGSPFTLTNNEYTAAHQYGNNYYLCLICQTDSEIYYSYINNPLEKLHLEKRIRQWEWLCEKYEGQIDSLKF